MPVFNLNTVHEVKEFYQETSFLGLISSTKDYRFCWLLNQYLGIDFKLNIDKEVESMKKKRPYFFSVYDYFDTLKWCQFDLYTNKYEGEFLLPEFKHIDFLWVIKGDSNFNDLMPMIRNIPEVQFTMNIHLDMIKNREHLIL
jgi:hypothetical protein